MADNVTIPASGTGTATPVVATDDVGGVHYQKVKLDLGGDGASNAAPVGAGTESGVLRVTLPTDGTGVAKAIHKESSAATASWTSATADETVLTLAVGGYASVLLDLASDGGTLSAGYVNFEGASDGGTNYAAIYGAQEIPALDQIASPVAAYSLTGLSGVAARFWTRFPVGGLTHFRVRLSTQITGTGTIALRLIGSTAGMPPSLVLANPGGPGVSGPLVYGYTGSVAQPIATDTSGRQIAVGAAAAGAAIAGNPVLMGGSDGTNARALKLDTSGDAQVDVLTLPNVTIGTNAALVAGTAYIGKVRLTDGTLDSSLVDETGASAVDALAVGGGTPHDSVDSGNPLKLGFKAANALPTAVASADRVNGIADLWGRQMVTHIDPAQQVWKSYNTTSTATGATIWDPTSGKKIAITSVTIGTYGTTAGRLILWFGANGDTTYSAGTDQLVLAASFAPSATQKPGLTESYTVPVFCTTADHELHITTDANLSVDVAVYGYEW